MEILTDQELLREYALTRSEEAFAAVVGRHVDFVYSAALRMVRDGHLAEDVTQGVFVALAGDAKSLSNHPMLSGWLHRTTRNLSANVVRSDVRRRAREEEAAKMNELLSGDDHAVWDDIAPHLDEALAELADADRDALLLRYFERKSAREIAAMLSVSDDAAQKRVYRAVERLRESLARRGVSAGTGGLIVVIGANAVQAAPVALTAHIVGAAMGAFAGGGISAAAVTTTKAIVMTTLQKTIITGSIVLAGVAGYVMYKQQAETVQLRREIAVLQENSARIDELTAENERLTEELAAARNPRPPAGAQSSEVLRLRGEVGRLRQENTSANSRSPLGGLLESDPEMYQLIRSQQKVGMGIIYREFARQLKLNTEQGEKLNDLLADDIMEGIDLITSVMREKKSPEEADQMIRQQEAALMEKLKEMFGPNAAADFEEYNRTLLARMSSDQFKGKLSGDSEAKDAKSKQLYQLIQEEAQAALAAAGLPADHQTLPILDFRNIAFEEYANRNVELLDTIYGRVATRAQSFLSSDEMERFTAYRTNAVQGQRAALLMNRKMMAPQK